MTRYLTYADRENRQIKSTQPLLHALCYKNSWIITISQLKMFAGSNTSLNLKTAAIHGGNPSGSISFEAGRSFFTVAVKDKGLIGIKGCFSLSLFSVKMLVLICFATSRLRFCPPPLFNMVQRSVSKGCCPFTQF